MSILLSGSVRAAMEFDDMKHKPFALAAAALMAGFLSFGFSGAQAASVMTGSGAPAGITKMQDGNIQDVSHRKYRRHWRGHNRWRGGHRWRRGSGVYLGLGFAPFFNPYYGGSAYYNGYYDAPAYYAPVRGSRHVRYCLDRYRSYDPRSNTFMGYDGYRHRCRSPYRY